jgi:hypothetical protein
MISHSLLQGKFNTAELTLSSDIAKLNLKSLPRCRMRGSGNTLNSWARIGKEGGCGGHVRESKSRRSRGVCDHIQKEVRPLFEIVQYDVAFLQLFY